MENALMRLQSFSKFSKELSRLFLTDSKIKLKLYRFLIEGANVRSL